MNVLLWMAAGGLVGLVSLVALNLNLSRGVIACMTIGMIAAFFGGHMLAPLLGGPMEQTGEFNPFALLVATASALGCLTISDMAAKRFGL